MLLAVGAATAPLGASAQSLTSAAGFLFDIDPGSGSLGNGTIDAYDSCYYLQVGGIDLYSSGATTLTLGGRQVELPETPMSVGTGTLNVRRLIYVPSAAGGSYARYLEVLTNPGASAVSTTVAIHGNLGSDSGTYLIMTSSGDATLTNSDLWFSTDDTDGVYDPSLAHVFQGDGATLAPSSVTLGGGFSPDNIQYQWSVTVPPSGRVCILHFAVQDMTQALVQATARDLAELPDTALMGIDEYLDDIVNWGASVPGAPMVHFDGPYQINEGDGAMISVSIDDPEGDTFTYSWDTNGDGTFGEMPGVDHYMVPAGTTDGPGSLRIGIEATDSGGNTVQRFRTITVDNVAPLISSSPPTLTSVGVNFEYHVEVTDPGGALDPPQFTVTHGPPSMVIDDTGVLMWMPGESDVTLPGESVVVEVQVSDGDDGTATQRWEMTVSPNRAPSAPLPLYPINRAGLVDRNPRLIAQNSSDPDFDPMTYWFQIDTSPNFDSHELQESGPLAETPGFAAWTPATLEFGRHYFWRVWTNDGTVDTDKIQADFFELPDPNAPVVDAGHDSGSIPADGGFVSVDAGHGEGGGGCGCRAAGSSPWTGAAWIGLGAILLVRRRRSR